MNTPAQQKILKDFIDSQHGKFFTVYFKKKDGTTRRMTCRKGVQKHLKGGVNKVEPGHPQYVTVFDMAKLAYRTINLETIEKINFQGKHFVVE